MIMRPGQQLLLPANPLFIWGSLLGAFGLNLLFNIALWGRVAWAPDLLALTLVFWGVHQPQRIGIGAAFVFALLIAAHAVALAVRLMVGGNFPGFALLLAPLIEALLWPLASLLLLLPQRRAPDPDANRPL